MMMDEKRVIAITLRSMDVLSARYASETKTQAERGSRGYRAVYPRCFNYQQLGPRNIMTVDPSISLLYICETPL